MMRTGERTQGQDSGQGDVWLCVPQLTFYFQRLIIHIHFCFYLLLEMINLTSLFVNDLFHDSDDLFIFLLN